MLFVLTTLTSVTAIVVLWSLFLPEVLPAWYRKKEVRTKGVIGGAVLTGVFGISVIYYIHSNQPIPQLPDASDQTSLMTPAAQSTKMQPTSGNAAPSSPPLQSAYSPQQAAPIQAAAGNLQQGQ
ncbi:MAG TPA: hypothetical protein VGS28_04320 [Candidatus Saccharimonadales bacterium]|nr:hypothetical protein [Candidatus Saccharimonadales bacterium]